MEHGSSFKDQHRHQIKELLHALGPAFGPAIVFLSLGAYWSRIKQGRSPFSPTLTKERRILPKAPLEGRDLSQEPYLRPVPYCDSHSPEVIGVADRFRKNTKSDWEYVCAIYDYVRNEIDMALEPAPPSGVAGTLEAGYGICLDKSCALVALARAGDIPARFCKMGNIAFRDAESAPPDLRDLVQFVETLESSEDWSLRKIGAGVMRRLRQHLKSAGFGNAPVVGLHPVVEFKIGNSWIMADPGRGDSEAIASGLPLPRLGYDPMLMLGYTATVIYRSETVPVGPSYWLVRRIMCMLARGAADIVNNHFEERRKEGERILSQIEKTDYIRSMRWRYVPLPSTVELEVPLAL
jgi:Transglutaminase-like superfamily